MSMSVDLAKLVVEVDASKVKEADATLQRFQNTARKTEDAASGLGNASQKIGTAARSMSDSVGKATNSFGLAGYQVRNFGHQITDLAVQIGSGGGLFRPLLQQGPQMVDALGGISGASGVVRTALAAIGPAGIAAFGAAAAAAGAFLASLNADETARKIQKITDQFALLQKPFGGDLGTAGAEKQVEGLRQAALKTGVAIDTLAAAQQNLVAAQMRGGTLKSFGIDPASVATVQTFVELLERTGMSAEESGDLVGRFFGDIRKGALSQETLNRLMSESPKFARAFVDAMGGSARVFAELQNGGKISAQRMMAAFESAKASLKGLTAQVPSLGTAFSKVAGQAGAAFQEIQLAFGGQGLSASQAMGLAVTKIGDAFVYVGAHAKDIVAPIQSFLSAVDRVGVGLGTVIERTGALQNFTSPVKMFEATASEISKITAGLDNLSQKARGFLDIADAPKFLTNTIAEIEKILALFDRLFASVTGGAGAARSQADAAARTAAAQAAMGDTGGGLGGGSSTVTSGSIGSSTTGQTFGPYPSGAQTTDAQFGPLLSEMQKQTSLQETFRDAVNAGTEAAKETATASQESTSAVKGLEATTYKVGDQTVSVFRPVPTKLDEVSKGVAANTGVNRSGFDRVVGAVGSLSGAMQSFMVNRAMLGDSGNSTVGPFDSKQEADEWAAYYARDNAQMKQWGEDGLHHGSGGTFTSTLGHQPSLGGMNAVYPGRGGGGLLPKMGAGTGTFGEHTIGAAEADYMSRSANDNGSGFDLGSLESLIQKAVGGLNPASPDPYKSSNPDVFYNNTTGQAITTEQTLKNLPKDLAREIVAALTQVGITGDGIGTGIVRAGTGTSVSPTSSPGYVPNLSDSPRLRQAYAGGGLSIYA